MSTFKIFNAKRTVRILGMSSSPVSKSVDVIFERYMSETDYAEGKIDRSFRFQFRNLMETTCDNSTDVANDELLYNQNQFWNYCKRDINNCGQQVLLNVNSNDNDVIQVISANRFGDSKQAGVTYEDKYNDHFSVYVS